MKSNIRGILLLVIVLMFTLFLVFLPNKVNAADEQGNFVIVLDPGHGGSDPGAIGGNLREDQVNFKIAQYAKQELEQYEGVKVYLTRYNDCPSIYDRVEIAKRYNADLLVSMHINSGNTNDRGAAIWVTQDTTQVQYYQKAADLGGKILWFLDHNMGIQNNGVQIRSGQPDEWYDSGVVQDYYGIIRYAQRVKMRSILIEHCFISNAQDRNFINTDDKIRTIAHSDVQGIVEAYDLKLKGTGYVPVKNIEINNQELNLEITSHNPEPLFKLDYNITPENATNQGIEWYSSDSSIVRVWEGAIRGLRTGTATITAITKSNQRVASIKVNVTKPEVPLESISIDKTEQTVMIDETGDIKVNFNPSNCSDQFLYWESSNPDVVRIWEGHFRGLKEGTSIITATSRAGGKKVQCKVNVKDKNKIYVEELELDKEEYTIYEDEAIDIQYNYYPDDAENTDFTWKSSNPEVLRVYWNRIRGLKEGTAEIIIKSPEGFFEKRVKVNVKKVTPEIIFDKEEIDLELNEATDIKCNFVPSNLTVEDFSWTASDPSILSVYWNRVRGLKAGTAEIIIKSLSDSSVEKRIKVKVNNNGSLEILPEKSNYNLKVNEAINIKCEYTPKNLTEQDFTWESSNPDVLRVYWNRIRGLKVGTADIIVKSLDGSYETRIKVNVEKNGEISMIPEKNTYELMVNEAIDIKCEYMPGNLSEQDFTWESSNPDVLRVYWNRIRGLKAGTADIIVKSLDGSYETRIKVNVKKNGEISILPDKTIYNLKVNEAIDIKCEYTPEKLTEQDFTWESSNPEVLRVYWNRIRGLKAGTADIIVKSLDGSYETRIKVNIN